jgi:hypothetical protein
MTTREPPVPLQPTADRKAVKGHRRIGIPGQAPDAVLDRQALSLAESEGWPPLEPSPVAEFAPGVRFTGWLRDEYRFWTEGSELTREEVFERLQAAVRGNTRDRKASAGLMFLIASDIETARNAGGASAPRPMSAWRACYKGLDRYLHPR